MQYNITIKVAGQSIKMVGIEADSELEAQNMALVQARSMVRIVEVAEA